MNRQVIYTAEYDSKLPKFNKSVSLLCWAYNEEELIDEFLERAIEILDCSVNDYEIVVIDDCSTDATNEIVRNKRLLDPRIKLFRNPRNMNVGLSFQHAIRRASKEFLFWQTVDWSYDITRLKTFLHLLNQCDVVAGVRSNPVQLADQRYPLILSILKMFHLKHLSRRSDNIWAAVISVINYALIRILFRVPVSDFQNLCFYRTSFISSLQFESRSSFSNPEHLIRSYWRGAEMIEVPISFIPREKGEAKGTRPYAVYCSIKDIVRLWVRWILLKRRGEVIFGSIRRLTVSEWEGSSTERQMPPAKPVT